jgi:hypothetical protein
MIHIQRPSLFPWAVEQAGVEALTAGQRALREVTSFTAIYGRPSSREIADVSRSYGFRPVFGSASSGGRFRALSDYLFMGEQRAPADESAEESDSSTVVTESVLARLEYGLGFLESLWGAVQTEAIAQVPVLGAAGGQ